MFISVIDGITSPITHAGPTAAPAAAEETVVVPPGGLIEWDGRNTIWDEYSSARMELRMFWENSFWELF